MATPLYGRYQTGILQTTWGQAISGASCYVLTQPADVVYLTPLATLYSDANGTPTTNPVITNGFGQAIFYAAPGLYTVVYKSPLFAGSNAGQIVLPDQLISTGGGSGDVTSVGLVMPSQFSVSGSPVTSSGTFTVTFNTETANTVFAGPVSGSAAVPTFRALVAADLPLATSSAFGAVKPDDSTITISGGVITAVGGITQLTGDVTAGPGSGSQVGTLKTVNSDVGSYTNANITVNAKGLITAAANGSSGTGTVSSVAMTVPTILSVSGSPITTSGTLALSLATQSANGFFAGPSSGSATTPTFRAIVPADLPVATTSALGVVKPDGTSITISGGVISATGAGLGTVTSVALSAPGIFTVSGSPVTTTGTLTFTLNTQSANLVFAGPSSGSAAVPTFRALATADLPAGNTIRPLGLTVDGGGTPPTTGIKGYLTIPFNCTVTGWTVIADQTGSVSFDIWFIAGSGAPPTAPNVPTSTNKISASSPVAISSAQSAAGGSSAISTWNTSLSQWGTMAFNLSSVTTCTRISVQLQVQLA